MEKFIKYLVRSLTFYTIIFCTLFFLSYIIAEVYGYTFLKPIYNIVLCVFILGTFFGSIQLFHWVRLKKIIDVIIIGIEIIIFSGIVYTYVTFYPTEERVELEGNNYIKVVHHSLISNDIEYYTYVNSLARKKNIKIQDDYTDGVGAHFLLATYYYDDDGNLIKKYDNNKKKMISIQKEYEENFKNYKGNAPVSYTKENEEVVVEPEILYEKKFDEKNAIRVVCKGYILAQRSAIGIERTYDGGVTWTEQLENVDKFIQIHNGAKFIFINENVGFINDYGLAGTYGENRSLMVTIDGGKNFKDVELIPNNYKEITYVDDVPYEEDGILKVKAHIVQDGQRIYCDLSSKDNGLTWIVTIL